MHPGQTPGEGEAFSYQDLANVSFHTKRLVAEGDVQRDALHQST
jgi:hypothetical protein